MVSSINEQTDEVTAAKFVHWLQSARPGEKLIYHKGFLAADREEVRLLQAPYNQYAHVFFEPLHSMAATVWRAYEQGRIELVQRRIGLKHHQTFEYIAIKRKERRRR